MKGCISCVAGLLFLVVTTLEGSVIDVQVEFGPDHMREALEKFSTVRNHIQPVKKDEVRKYISDWITSNVLAEKGIFLRKEQHFETPGLKYSHGAAVPGVNYIHWTMSTTYGSSKDKPIVVAGHYDSKSDSPGVDDNGSGMAALMEAFRLMIDAKDGGKSRIQAKNTVHFVAFDMGEYDHEGSKVFLEKYYVPDFLVKHNISKENVQVIILCSLMNFDEAEDSQDIPYESYVEQHLPVFHSTVTGNGKKGNFLLVLSRLNDATLAEEFLNSFNNISIKYGHERYKAYYMGLQVAHTLKSWPKEARNLVTDAFNYDQISFWNYTDESYTQTGIKSILLTDTGGYRGNMRKCHKGPCDDMATMATETNIQFLTVITKALAQFLVDKSTEQSFNITYVEKGPTSVGVPCIHTFPSISTVLAVAVITQIFSCLFHN